MKTVWMAIAMLGCLACPAPAAELTPLVDLVRQPGSPLLYLVKRCSAVTSVLAAQTGAAQGEASSRYRDIEKVAVYFTGAVGTLIQGSDETADAAAADIGAMATQYDEAIRANHQAGGKLVADDYGACVVIYRGS